VSAPSNQELALRQKDEIASMTFVQKVALYKRLKDEQPDIAQFIDSVANLWPGAKVTYVKIGVECWGTTASVLYPAIPSPLYKPDSSKGKRR
jgi:hypothetical protein